MKSIVSWTHLGSVYFHSSVCIMNVFLTGIDRLARESQSITGAHEESTCDEQDSEVDKFRNCADQVDTH